MRREHSEDLRIAQEKVKEACAKIADSFVHDAEHVLWVNPNNPDIQQDYVWRRNVAAKIADAIRALKLEVP